MNDTDNLAEQLLHGGDTEDFPLIGVETRIGNGLCYSGFIGVSAITATFDQFPTSPVLTADSLLQSVFLYIKCPGGQCIDLAENVGNLIVIEKCRILKIMDLRQMGSPYEKKYIELTEEDRKKVTDVYHAWQQVGYEETYQNIPEFCYSAHKSEIAEKGYTLVPSRYIEFVNRDENIDFDTKMKTLQSELTDLLVAEEKSKADLLSVFKELGYEIKL